MTSFAICTLGAAQVHAESGFPLIAASSDVTGDGDTEGFGDLAVYSSLGVTALPYQVTDDGHCEALVVRDVGGLDGVIIGARDERAASIYGELQPGDTVLHSTGEQLSSMVMCKEDRKQVVLRTKASDGKDMMVVMDGTSDTITITGFQTIFEMKRDAITIGIKGSGTAAISLYENGQCWINCTKFIAGPIPTAASPFVVGPTGLSGIGSTTCFGSIRAALSRAIERLIAEVQLGAHAHAL